MKNKTWSMVLAAAFVLATAPTGAAQKLSESALRRLDGSAVTFPGAKLDFKLGLATPRSLRFGPIFNNSAPIGQASAKSNPGGLPGIDSVPNFTRAFRSQGQLWPFTMMGNDPALGRRTQIPARIIAVSLELQNADLATTTTVPIAPFERLTLNSPNFKEADYSSGENIQFADAIQRAEFFNSMRGNWHTELHPSIIVDHVTIQVPRTISVPINGVPTDVRTYFTGPTDDGGTFVLLLDQFFNDAEAALQRDVASERLDARRRGQQEEIAVLVKIDRVAHFVAEPLEHTDRFDRQPDVRLVRELVAHAAGVAAGGSGAEHRLALDEDDVGHAAPREVIGDRRAHAPAADDHDVGRPLHRVAALPPPAATRSTASITRRMLPPRIFSTSASL